MKVRQARHRSHETSPVRRVAIGAVHDGLDTRVTKNRHARRCRFEHRLEAIESGLQQAAMKILGNAIETPRLRCRLEGTDDERIHLSAHVVRRVSIAEYRKLEFHLAHFVDGFGNEKMVLERNDGKIDTEELTEAARPLTGSVDDDLRADVAFRRLDDPSAP